VSKIRNLLDWSSGVSLEDGLKRTADWYKDATQGTSTRAGWPQA
jgi:nucleoside-diphosphate-sugar epimerase